MRIREIRVKPDPASYCPLYTRPQVPCFCLSTTRLDADILNKFALDPDKLAAWRSATHVERGPKKEIPAEPTPPPPAT